MLPTPGLTGAARTNPFDQSFDKGPSNFDRRHIFNLSGLWELPFQVDNGAKWLVNGWSLNAIASLYDGTPFTVTSGVDNARTGTGGQRADLVGNPDLGDGRTRGEQIAQYMDKAAFAPNALGTFGNLGRNTYRGPGFANWDFGLFKRFQLTESLALTYRFEAFNALEPAKLGPSGFRTQQCQLHADHECLRHPCSSDGTADDLVEREISPVNWLPRQRNPRLPRHGLPGRSTLNLQVVADLSSRNRSDTDFQSAD
ncbi:MAG: hypothetical protein U5J83_03000 [Bryobacterales bacterium]|nr:hypothetical protein [Bryobacterales bacterium]